MLNSLEQWIVVREVSHAIQSSRNGRKKWRERRLNDGQGDLSLWHFIDAKKHLHGVIGLPSMGEIPFRERIDSLEYPD